MSTKADELLAKELQQAKDGVHQRQKGEEKRLAALKQTRIRKAEHLRQLRVDQVEVQYEAVRREVRAHRAARPPPRPRSRRASSPLATADTPSQ